MPDSNPDVRIAIEHSIRVLSRWTLILYVCVSVVFGVLLYTTFAQRKALRESVDDIHTSLCIFVVDLQHRVDDTERYLRNHPGKEPIPGVTRADLRRSLVNQKNTVDSLNGLGC